MSESYIFSDTNTSNIDNQKQTTNIHTRPSLIRTDEHSSLFFRHKPCKTTKIHMKNKEGNSLLFDDDGDLSSHLKNNPGFKFIEKKKVKFETEFLKFDNSELDFNGGINYLHIPSDCTSYPAHVKVKEVKLDISQLVPHSLGCNLFVSFGEATEKHDDIVIFYEGIGDYMMRYKDVYVPVPNDEKTLFTSGKAAVAINNEVGALHLYIKSGSTVPLVFHNNIRSRKTISFVPYILDDT